MAETSERNSSAGFRQDINGLRAWAVIAVILFHFDVPGFSGGFVGVDVFFVISGYLMTAIVIKGLELGSFSVFDFYAARIRRIVPALMVLCIALLAIGYFLLSPLDYKQLATHVLSALGFFSNFKFWSEAGYFDVASHEKWLLHTWSLSVEWQFYLLLPIVLAAAWRLSPGRRTQLLVLLSGTVLSFAVSVVMTEYASNTAFYLLPARAWEMLAGGVVFLLTTQLNFSRGMRLVIELAGFAIVIGTVILFDGSTPWPGWRSAMPVVGTVLVLAARRDRSLWTGHPLAQWLGDRSYSLYLWHWPMVVALAFIQQRGNPLATFCGITLTLLLGHVSCRWVELPVRRTLGQLTKPHFWAGSSVAIGLVLLTAFAVRLSNGLEGRMAPEVEKVAAESENVNPRREKCHSFRGVESPSCVWGGEEWRILALGDSHMSATVTAIAEAGGENAGVVQWTYSGCSYVLDLKILPEVLARQKSDYLCHEFVQWASSRLLGLKPALPVVIVNRYAVGVFGANEEGKPATKPGIYFSEPFDVKDDRIVTEFKAAIVKTACEAAISRQTYLVRPIPEMGFDVPKVLARRLAFGYREDVSIARADYFARNRWVWEAQDEAVRQCGVKILDPTEVLCDEERCYGSRNLKPLYSDDDHLSEFGNKLLVPMFKQVYADIADSSK